jgi:hypothetical protein
MSVLEKYVHKHFKQVNECGLTAHISLSRYVVEDKVKDTPHSPPRGAAQASGEADI